MLTAFLLTKHTSIYTTELVIPSPAVAETIISTLLTEGWPGWVGARVAWKKIPGRRYKSKY